MTNDAIAADLAARLESGKEVLVSSSDPAPISYGLKTPGETPEATAKFARFAHFFWPFSDGDGTLIGEPTEEERRALADRAFAAISKNADGASAIRWRCKPEWETERSFDTQETRHKLYLRGSFAWN